VLISQSENSGAATEKAMLENAIMRHASRNLLQEQRDRKSQARLVGLIGSVSSDVEAVAEPFVEFVYISRFDSARQLRLSRDRPTLTVIHPASLLEWMGTDRYPGQYL
jgi:hypothetical protein